MVFSQPQIKYQICYELLIHFLTEKKIFLPLLLTASTKILTSATYLKTMNQLELESFVTDANC